METNFTRKPLKPSELHNFLFPLFFLSGDKMQKIEQKFIDADPFYFYYYINQKVIKVKREDVKLIL